ncbi:MAG TPA: restriction endonuclease subunit S [Rubrivivax sp.]|jgi:type I restriction enzyme S subunit|nr:restriction endonuclease subunit S [Rubrivivax sp.]
MTWRHCRLGEVMRLQRGHDLPIQAREEGDVPVVSSSGVTGFHSKAKAPAPGVVTGRYGTLGEVYYIDRDYWPLNTALYVTDFLGNEPRFVAHLLKQALANYQSDKAAVPGVDRNVVHELPVRVPDTETQRRIAEVVSDYDDLIDNNRRRINLLEDSVRLVFDEWFVRMRFPGYESRPLVDGLPHGWARSTVGSVVLSLEDGDWIESKDQGGDDFRILQISNIGLNEFRETGNFRYITEETFSRLRCREVLPGMILVARMPTPIGRAMMVTQMPWRMVTAVDVAIIESDDALVGAHYLLYHLNSDANLAQCEALTVGATRPRVTRRNLAELPLLIPDKATQAAFRAVAADVHAQRVTLSRQVERLTAARDLLLPRMMSGELTV